MTAVADCAPASTDALDTMRSSYLVDLWLSPDYRAIAPSRFGYLGSTMPAGATVADQADVYAALLDHLGLRQVVMVGFSAGGPAAIQFALRHPDRLFGLILGSSYLPGMGAKTVPKALHPLVRAVAGWELGWWLLKRYRPTRLARVMGVPKGWDPSGDEDFLGIREALFPVGPKKYGIAFDALESEPASNDFPLEDIAVPTLLVHAADDRLAPYEFAPAAAARIRGARLVTIPAGGHLFLRHAADTRQATTAFVTDVVAGTRRASASPIPREAGHDGSVRVLLLHDERPGSRRRGRTGSRAALAVPPVARVRRWSVQRSRGWPHHLRRSRPCGSATGRRWRPVRTGRTPE
jgi:pimeloyl-ACP methyl ester carboxylesterase